MTEPSSPVSSAFSAGIKPSIYDYCVKYLATIVPQYESCTVIDQHRLCSYAHNRDGWNVGKQVQVVMYDQRKITVTVVSVDEKLDVVWMHSEDALCEMPPLTGLPSEGISYFVIGNSGMQLQESPRTVNSGIVCSSNITNLGHILGSSGSSPGDSGSPIFRQSTGVLMGMVVGAENVSVLDVESKPVVAYRPRAYIVPINSLLLGGKH